MITATHNNPLAGYTEVGSPAEPPPSKEDKTIQERLKKNLRYATDQQANQVKDGLSGFRIQIPKEGSDAVQSEQKTISHREVGIASAQGRRRSMEDRDIATRVELFIDGEHRTVDVFGVFDGHGGSGAADFVQSNIGEYLLDALQTHNRAGFTDEGIWDALKECCVWLHEDYQGVDGTTATMAVIIDDMIWVANVGDSRTVISDNDTAIQLTEDAKPDAPRYLGKIMKEKGFVIGRRLNGWLAVARAIGDKTRDPYAPDTGLSHRPKITRYPMAKIKNGYLILACDGLYDVATTNEVVAAVNAIRDQGMEPSFIAKTLVHSAIECGSRDNVTAMVIELNPRNTLP